MAKINVWLTKYALTTGILKVKADFDAEQPSTVAYKFSQNSFTAYAHGNEWHRTEQEAFDRAEEMRIAKLKSLDKQAKKIAAMKFKVV